MKKELFNMPNQHTVAMKQPVHSIMILVTVILMDLLSGMEFDLFVPSFPELQNQFSLSPFMVEALLSVNFVGYCLSLFLVGGFADRYGRKPIILFGLIIFVIGSILCLWPVSYSFLLTGRFLQGVGVAAPAILSFLIIADSYTLKQQQYWLAMLNGLMNAAAGAAPVIGSYITLYFHWQGNFVVLLVLGLVVLAMTLFFIPASKRADNKETLSLGGYIPIFRSRTLMLLILHFVFMFVPYWVFVGMSPLLYMKDLGVSLSHFGYYQGALALVFAFGSICFGLVLNRFEQKKLLYISNLIFMFGLGCIALITIINSSNALFITLAFIPFIIGQIIPTTILYPLCLNLMPKAKGRVTAIIQGGRLIFCALSLQLSGFFYKGSVQSIGIILICFIVLVIFTLFLVIKNYELIHLHKE